MKEEVIIHRQVKGWMVDIFNIDIDDKSKNFKFKLKETFTQYLYLFILDIFWFIK